MSSTTDLDATPKATTHTPTPDPDKTPTAAPQTRTLAPPSLVTSASISHREYIYHLPYPLPSGTPIPYTLGLPSTNPLNLPPHPFEPTSTLVLTSPHRTFVDTRFLRPLSPSDPDLPNPGPASRLEWAFAGSSSSTLLPASDPDAHETYPTARAAWSHWLDSRVPLSSPSPPPPDEGLMFTVSETRALEHGHAEGPGGVRSHEEMWRDDEVGSTNPAGTKVCAVLRCGDDEAGVRGVVVRVGEWVQGVMQGPEGVTVERWKWEGGVGEGQEEEDGWKRVARVGDGFLPCCVPMKVGVLVLGGQVKYGSVEWMVEELWEWV